MAEMQPRFRVSEADITDPAVTSILEAHLEFARRVTPPGHVHALDASGLASSDVTTFSLSDGQAVVAIGALRELSSDHGEIKSMHTVAGERGRGLGRHMATALLEESRRRGYSRVSLETGTMDAFEPARHLYESLGFEVCEPFGDYLPVPNSVCMTLYLD